MSERNKEVVAYLQSLDFKRVFRGFDSTEVFESMKTLSNMYESILAQMHDEYQGHITNLGNQLEQAQQALKAAPENPSPEANQEEIDKALADTKAEVYNVVVALQKDHEKAMESLSRKAEEVLRQAEAEARMIVDQARAEAIAEKTTVMKEMEEAVAKKDEALSTLAFISKQISKVTANEGAR